MALSESQAMMYGLEATSAVEFLAQRLVRLEQPVRDWAAQMKQIVALRQAAGLGPIPTQRVAAH
jgi:hypothetical protein